MGLNELAGLGSRKADPTSIFNSRYDILHSGDNGPCGLEREWRLHRDDCRRRPERGGPFLWDGFHEAVIQAWPRRT